MNSIRIQAFPRGRWQLSACRHRPCDNAGGDALGVVRRELSTMGSLTVKVKSNSFSFIHARQHGLQLGGRAGLDDRGGHRRQPTGETKGVWPDPGGAGAP